MVTQSAIDRETAERLRAVIGRIRGACAPRVAGEGLTPSQISVLFTVVRRGPLGISELAEFEALNPTMLSRIVAQLCRAGPRPPRGARERPPRCDRDARPLPAGACASASSASGRARSPRSSRRSIRRLASSCSRRCRRSRSSPSGCAVSARFLAAGRATFSALAVPNYRRYISGQAISLIGTWMQMTAQSWLVLTLTGSSTTLGLIVALQTLPVLAARPLRRRRSPTASTSGALMVVLQARWASRRSSSACSRSPHRRHGLGDRRARGAARLQQRVREPGAPVVHERDGRRRQPAQRRQPELGARQRRARRSARRSPAS